MELEKRKYEFFVTRQTYDNKLLKTRFIKEINYLNRLNELSEIAECLMKEKFVVDVFYQEYKEQEKPQYQFIDHVKKLDEPFTESEIDYGLEAIFQKRRKQKTLYLSSDNMKLSEVFDIATKLNRYAEEQAMNVTIIATNPN